MLTALLSKVTDIQIVMSQVMVNCIDSVSPTSEGGETITQSELDQIILNLNKAMLQIKELVHALERGSVVESYNNFIISATKDCKLCQVITSNAKIEDIVKNPVFTLVIFSIKDLLILIDDKIAEKDHHGIRKCIEAICYELNNFPELAEVAQSMEEVSCTFTDITMISDMMFDFEKFFKSVFLLHEELNVGIALGSIKSVLPPPDDGDIEFF